MSTLANSSPFEILVGYVWQFQQRGTISVAAVQQHASYLACSAGAENYLIGMGSVLEVTQDLPTITPLPFCPFWLLGLTSHRGDVCSVTDFKYFVEPKAKYATQKKSHYIVLRDAGQGYILKVDSISGIRQVEVNALDSKRIWVDGHIFMEDKDWFRINIGHLINDAVFSQQMQ